MAAPVVDGVDADVHLDEVADALGSGHAQALDTALERALAAAVNSQQILASALNHFATLRRWRTEVDLGKSPAAVLDGARPRPHFSRRATLERQLRVWTDDALNAVARKAIQRKTGARGLRSILEAILLDTMYELPTYDGVEEVVVNAEVVEGRAQPLIIYAERRDKGGAA